MRCGCVNNENDSNFGSLNERKYTHSHVRLVDCVNSFDDQINQVSRNNIVENFYAAFPVYQYVTRLNILMDDLELN